MAKRLLLNVLIKVLGEFIELDENNLSLAVWSGTVALTDLKLKTDNIMKKFNFVIHHGSVKKLELTIPWASLLNNPLKVKLDGVLLDIGPIDIDSLNKAEILQRMLQEKLQKLKMNDQFLEMTSGMSMNHENQQPQSTTDSSSQSYVQQWTSRVIDNIEISFSNIHFRYEDPYTIPGTIFSAGLTLESFVVNTCDDKWLPAYISKSPGSEPIINKLATIHSLGLYWEVNSSSIASLPFNLWKERMLEMIYKGGKPANNLHYIVSPIGASINMRLTHNKRPNPGQVRFSIAAESSDLKIHLDNSQFFQVYQLKSSLSALKEIHGKTDYRPQERPIGSSRVIKQWWRYAKTLVLLRPKYIKLLKMRKKAEMEGVRSDVLLSKEDVVLFEDMEKRLPYKVLKAYRYRAFAEMMEEMHFGRFKEHQKESVGLWGWLGSGSASQHEKDSDISLEEIIDEFNNQEMAQTKQSFSEIKIALNASSTIVVSSAGRNIMELQGSVKVDFQRIQGSIYIKCDLQNISLIDMLGVCPFHSQIITVKSTDLSKPSVGPLISPDSPTLSVVFQEANGRIKVRITSLPIEVFINKIVFHSLLTEFIVPKPKKNRRFKNHNSSSLPVASANQVGEFSAQALTEALSKGQADVEITLEAHGPKIIIPEDCTKDSGYLLLDCGFIALNCAISSSGMVTKVAMQSINAGLPLRISDIYSLENMSLYLIKPFNIRVDAQNVDQSIADITAGVSIEPALRGDIDPVKLARLLRILNGATDIFSPKTSPLSGVSVHAKAQSEDALFELVSPSKADASFSTPSKLSLSQPASNDLRKAKQSPSPMTSNRVSSPIPMDAKEATNIDMKLSFSIPDLSLDLLYDLDNKHYLIFSLGGLKLEMINRPYDRQIVFGMGEFSIQDSFRAESQRYVASTPKTASERLIDVSYTSILNSKSPLYTTHGSIMKLEFADLSLNVDTNTLLKLKPFFEALLDKNNRLSSVQSLHDASSIQSSSTSSNRFQLITTFLTNTEAPPGMKVEATLGAISIGLLRAATSFSQAKGVLETAFTIIIADMRVKIDMQELMTSSVCLRTVEIVDNRNLSKEYVFKKLFSPIISNEKTQQALSSINVDNEEKAAASSQGSSDLVTLLYSQELKGQTFINVLISGVASFVAVDAMLDFALIAMANFFAFTSLLSSPNPPTTPSAAPEQVKLNNSLVDSASPRSEDIVSGVPPSIDTPCAIQSPTPKPTTIAKDQPSCYTMNCSLKMVNSRLILLEDPAIKESRAIVGQCAAEVHFTREIRNSGAVGSKIEQFESLHVSVSDNEVFVLRSMNSWNPVPILDPFDVELHLKRSHLNGVLISTSIQLEMDDIDARLSFNDLMLGHSIYSRRSLVDVKNSKDMNSEENSPGRSQQSPGSTPTQPEVSASAPVQQTADAVDIPPTTTIQFGLTSLNVIIANDFHATAIPVLKLFASEINFIVEGGSGEMSGEGSSLLRIDYFNSPILTWEPVLDNWKPGLKIKSDIGSKIFEIRSETTLQLSISGAMLETILKSYSIFFHDNDAVPVEDRLSLSEISILNNIGNGIDADVYESSTRNKLVTIGDRMTGQVTAFPDSSKKAWMKSFRLPNAVDIYFRGSDMECRQPLIHLPFTANKPKACMLQPIMDLQSKEKKTFVMEPIEEEVFENSRYDPISGRWRLPFLLGDPYEWTDASGLVKRDISSITIQSETWEWVGRWEVDMDGVIGRDIDEDGWEYASSFSFFSMVSARRAFQMMDGVRRRRWTRTRVPKLTDSFNVFRPLVVFWDVKTLANGSRLVQLRSGFQIVNSLSFKVFVSLQHSSWPDEVVLGPIGEGETLNVPILQSFAAQMRFKPDSEGSEWSSHLSCNIHSYDFKNAKDVRCGNSCSFRVWTIREDKSLLVKLTPYLVINNRLLCSLEYRCEDVAYNVLNKDVIVSGSTSKLGRIGWKEELFVSISFGSFDFCRRFSVNRSKSEEGVIEMTRPGAAGSSRSTSTDILPVCYASKIQSDYTIELDIFFKVAMIDRTGLNLLVLSNYNQKDYVRRFSMEPILRLASTSSDRDTSSAALTLTSAGNLRSKDSKPQVSKLTSSSLVEDIRILTSVEPPIVKCELGSSVYSDVNFKWCHLPLSLRGKFSLRFSFADLTVRSSQFLRFRVMQETIVFVLSDASAPPRWLQHENYQLTTELAVSRRIAKNRLTECNYAIYGKIFASETEVVMGGSWENGSNSMFSVILVPTEDWSDCDPSSNEALLLLQIKHKSDFAMEFAGLCWSEGCNNVTAFYTRDNLIQVRTGNEDVWSEEISIDTRKNSSTKDSFEIHSQRSGMGYQLSYSIQNLPGLYHQTQLVTFMPRYCVLNCTEESLFIAQKGSNKHLEFFPYTPEGWHMIDDRFDSEVKFRTQSTIWSLGSVNINEMGTSVLYIPYSASGSAVSSRGIVLHVEVKVASHKDNCSVIIIIWQEMVETQATMSIHNDTDVPITIRQADIELDYDLGGSEVLYELTVPPGKHLPFGLCDPNCGSNVLVAVGTSLQQASKRIATFNILKDGQRLRLPYSISPGSPIHEVILRLGTSDCGHILRVSKSSKTISARIDSDVIAAESVEEEEASVLDRRFLTVPIFGINVILASFGVSLVVENPRRRELFSLYVDGVELNFRSKGSMKTVEFLVMDLQVDNYSESAIYPIILRGTKKDIHKSVSLDSDDIDESERRYNESEKPLIQLSVVQDVTAESNRPVIKYVALRVLSLAVEVDSASIQLLFLDLLDDLKILSSAQAVALSMPQRWYSDFNRQVFYPGQHLVNVYHVKQSAQRSKMYVKKLIIHPIKVTITLYQVAFPRKEKKETLQSTVLNAILSLAGVEKMQIKLTSLEVEDAMESFETLVSLILTKTGQDLRSQLGQIAGSLALIGSPINFSRKVGSGVRAFFYEPYLGAVQGSNDFLSGLKKGTTRLITGVVSGAMDSAVAFVGTASKGISYLSGDAEYVRKRASKRQQIRTGQKGIYHGFREGGESVMSGFSSALTGLISKPFEEAAKDGVSGFFKGLGLGMLGVAVKPLVGMADGLTSIAYGISSEVDPDNIFIHVRPPRALEPSAVDSSLLIITPLNLEAAYAQEFVMKRSRQNHYEDQFLCYVPLATKGDAIILSDVYIFWRKGRTLWGRVWANISHCIPMGTALGIMLYSGALQGDAEVVVIPCGSTVIMKRLYAAVATHAHRMGNPSKVVPSGLVDWAVQASLPPLLPDGDGDKVAERNEMYSRLRRDATLLGELDQYRFGSVNGKRLMQIAGSESDVIARAQFRIQESRRGWKELDECIWTLLWEWGCVHANLAACRSVVALLINRSDSPIQVTRVQMTMGRNVIIIGSSATGYESESRLLWPKGYVVVFMIAFPQSPLEVGHIKATINSAAFTIVLASTQRESFCEAKGGFSTGFLEKTASEWWCKYVIVAS